MDESPAAAHELYGSLARWWPLVSPPEEYAEEAAFLGSLFESAERPVTEVLELGSGGGHLASHLAGRFRMTLVDLAEEMLEVSRALNPGCEHRQGDMREVRLGRRFDAVLIHDAVEYMITHDDLDAAVATAAAHCRPGGVVVLVPDHTSETFEPGEECGGSDAPDGTGARYLEWTLDPDPSDTWVETHYTVLVRDAAGDVRAMTESHRTGLFPRQVWLDVLSSVGLEASSVTEETAEERDPREVFLGRRPA